jgi:hypothetical protein
VNKREFKIFEKKFDDFSRIKAILNRDQGQRLISTLKEWHNDNSKHSEQEYAKIIRCMADLKFSGTYRERQDLIIVLTDEFLEKKEHSFRGFALFLTGLRGLKYLGHFLNEKQRQRTVGVFNELKEDCNEKVYSELISGIVGLGIHWDEIYETGKQNLLNQLEPLKSEITANGVYNVVFNFGKLGANLKNLPCRLTIIELTEKAMTEMQADNGQGKLKLPRAVR